MVHGRRPAELFPRSEGLFHLAPIPLVMHQVEDLDHDRWHRQLIDDAISAFSNGILEVPDVRHIHDLGVPPDQPPDAWCERQTAAVGVWHRVPTNQYLSLQTDAIARLRCLVEYHYCRALLEVEGIAKPEAHISESWIQFYQSGDYKVLHNHERYGPPYPQHRWAGAYYIDDGAPDLTMPYSGVFSFRVREVNHFVRPVAGLLLIWPADVLHEVHPFYGARPRIVVNFNVNSTIIDWKLKK